ncbi:MAG: 6-phosphofructokinase [Crocinitomicaceae bacterium]|nr:6-phosphofructokinase [Crocinitomicaceae bacterium]
MKRIGIITSGGDAPGMNACIRSIAKYCLNNKIDPVGYFDGFDGIIDGRSIDLCFSDVDNIVQKGGTILGTARCEEFKTKEGRSKAISTLKGNNIDALICIGGDGTFTGANILSSEMDIPVIGVPGTIDNDIAGTDYTIGYDTALNTVIEAVDKIRDTAGSHHRIFFVEVMGRNAGFIALNSAIASGAETVLIPEELTDIDAIVLDLKEQSKGRRSSIVIVAEGDDGGGAKEIMDKVSPLMQRYSLRCSILGHIQRGGSPSAFDRILAGRMGAFAVEQLQNGVYNVMVGIKGGRLITCSIEDGIRLNSSPDLSKLELLRNLRTLG